MKKETERENMHALFLQQALLGTISANVRFIWIQSKAESLIVNITLEQESQSDRDEFEELIVELEVLFDRPFDIIINIEIKSDPIFMCQCDGRPVYRRKE